MTRPWTWTPLAIRTMGVFAVWVALNPRPKELWKWPK